MNLAILSDTEFRRQFDLAREMSSSAPVILTVNGARYALMRLADLPHHKGADKSLSELLSAPSEDYVEFEPPRFGEVWKPADLG